VSAEQVAEEPGWIRVTGVPLVRQRAEKDCGAAALSSVLGHWRSAKDAALSRSSIDAALKPAANQGIAARDLRDYARKAGFAAFVFKGTVRDLQHELALQRPVIVGMHKPVSADKALAHYEVVIGYHPQRRRILTFDPARGLQQNSVEGFLKEWAPAGQVTLVVIPEPG
jgi:ABC-type bacteriocin/lantibiotic exporter with double-glycine peptidase domain